ncbi:MAG: tetratricopeptide repeat protein [Bacteroidota bacterium]|nr:tetratricopeptide repeat protein [Bacteroidota bacterium]MDP4231192.1 tetratricopeptide repeat protein [Bacteroidota bacterium]MDP4235572.1 tetratricopeptide repeat protein [Bacteroidota bacterium]
MRRLHRAYRTIYRKNVLILLLLGLSAVASCTLFRNFTTYFNVVYLAQQHLDIYESQLDKDQVAQNGAVAAITTHRWLEEEYLARQLYKKRTGLPMPMASFNKTTVSTNRSASTLHLDSAIILGSKVLADKKETKYIEDALFIVGKSQYYKNDYAGAKRKFNELLFRYPNTKYGTEVGMLLARAMMATNQFDTATSAIGSVLKNAEQSGNTTDISEAHKAYAELVLASNPDSLSLAAEQLRLAENGLSSDAAARLSYERGALYFLDGKWSAAEAAFRATIDRSSDAGLQGEAMVSLGETLRREKKFAEAKQTFLGVSLKTRYANSHPPAQYEFAYTVDLESRESVGNDLKSPSYKLDYYPSVKATYNALDTTYRTISQAIMARSRFRQAEIYRGMGEYDSASHIANIILGTKDFSSGEMNDYVNDRIRALTRFAEWKYQLAKVDTVEHLLKKLRRPGSTMQQGVNREIRTLAEQQVLGSRWHPEQTPVITPEEEKLIAQYEERIRKEKSGGAVSSYSINFADTTKYIDSIHNVAMHAHFELGRAFENFVEYPSAIAEYQEALTYTFMRPDSSINGFRAQVLFTWVELDHELGNAVQRDSLITVLTKNYGETIYAQQASKEYAGIRDKDSPGEVAFRSAYATLKTSGLDNAKNALLAIVSSNKHEDVAARALYTIGVSYEDKSRFDSAVVYYRRVINEYPFSKYAEYLRPKMLYALQEAPKQGAQKNTQVQQQNVTVPNQKTLQDSARTTTQTTQKPPVPKTKEQKPPPQPVLPKKK